jgi:hypothetical protein
MIIFRALVLAALFLAGQSLAFAITREDLADGYFVGKADVPGPGYVAECHVSTDGSAVVFRDARGDSLRKDMDCTGGFEVANDIATVKVTCLSTAEDILFEVDLRNVTKAQLESGVRVNARGSITSGQWTPFKVQKQSQPFFPKE